MTHPPVRRPARAALLAVLSLVLPVLAPASGAPAAPAAPASLRDAEPSWTYDARFDLELRYLHQKDFGASNLTSDSAEVQLKGAMTRLSLSRTRLYPNKGGTLLTSGFATHYAATDDGNHVVDCLGEDVRDHTGLQPRIGPVGAPGSGRTSFYPFFSIYAVMTCSATSESPYEDLFELEPTNVPVTIPLARAGDATITVPVKRELSWEECPGSDEEGTDHCTYTITGTLVLTRRAEPVPFEQPTRPALDRRGRASVTAGCQVACTVGLTVTPLRGGRALGRTTTKLRAGGSARLTTHLSAAEQRLVTRSGGARLVTTYSAPGESSRTWASIVRR